MTEESVFLRHQMTFLGRRTDSRFSTLLIKHIAVHFIQLILTFSTEWGGFKDTQPETHHRLLPQPPATPFQPTTFPLFITRTSPIKNLCKQSHFSAARLPRGTVTRSEPPATVAAPLYNHACFTAREAGAESGDLFLTWRLALRCQTL